MDGGESIVVWCGDKDSGGVKVRESGVVEGGATVGWRSGGPSGKRRGYCNTAGGVRGCGVAGRESWYGVGIREALA